MSAIVSMMMASAMTPEEEARFNRVGDSLCLIFERHNYAVRVCRASGSGEARMIEFIAGLTGPALVSLKASRFLAMTDEELQAGLEQALAQK